MWMDPAGLYGAAAGGVREFLIPSGAAAGGIFSRGIKARGVNPCNTGSLHRTLVSERDIKVYKYARYRGLGGVQKS